MKRIYTTIILSLCWVMTLVAQPRFSSSTETINLGQVGWKIPVKAEFVIRNTGNKPLVLTNVDPDCACTVAEWTKTPISGGKQGVISVTYDAETLGHFNKSIAIYTNAKPHLVYLHLSGQVVEHIKDYSRTHPIQIGDLRISKAELAFPDIHRGENPEIKLNIVNLSDQVYEPVLMHLPSYLQAVSTPAVLQAGGHGTITVKLLSEKLDDLGLTQVSVYLSRFTGDKVSEENAMPMSVVLLPDFSHLTPEQLNNAPIAKLSTEEINLKNYSGKKKLKATITLSNNGHEMLDINKLQVFHPSIGVGIKKTQLAPGESTQLKLTINRNQIEMDDSIRRLSVLMITNDPQHPKLEVKVKN